MYFVKEHQEPGQNNVVTYPPALKLVKWLLRKYWIDIAIIIILGRKNHQRESPFSRIGDGGVNHEQESLRIGVPHRFKLN